MKTLVLALAALALVGTAAQANAQYDLGASAGLYLPTSGNVRDAFGSQILKFGFGSVGKVSTGNLKIGTGLDFITANKNGNRMLVIPFTVNVEQALTMDRNASTKPYVKGFAGLAYMDFGITTNAIRTEEKAVRMTVGAEFGIVMSDRIRLSARYNYFPKVGGYDLSGISLNATFGFGG
ncbi:hypothetical protein BH11ARM1_BH11ARM1_08550 [soil metagenome]